MKPFLISIDTEGDNLWAWKRGEAIKTANVEYLKRFQDLCTQFCFKPTYLTNWEVIEDDKFVSWVKPLSKAGQCEVGMHLHAWNSPPLIELDNYNGGGNDYLIEYDKITIEKKVDLLTNTIEKRIGTRPVVHRAGRWAMDQRYFDALAKAGYLCDCSITPGVDWSNTVGAKAGSSGSNYSSCSRYPGLIHCEAGNLIEIPLTTVKGPRLFFSNEIGFRPLKRVVKGLICGNLFQLRPSLMNYDELLYVVNHCASDDSPCLMFMLHSSEFMPGGSPNFVSAQSIENLYAVLERLFLRISSDYYGCTIGDYAITLEQSSLPPYQFGNRRQGY